MLPHTLEGELQRRQMRRDYGSYVAYVNAPQGFYMTHFHRYLCDTIQAFLEHKCDKAMDILLLSVPPRHGKSFTVTETLPSWYLGKHPQASVILCGYEGTFAESFSRRNRDKFNEYATDIFGSDVQPNKNVQGVALWETSQGGRCRAAGLKGGITGYGADLFIIDDPIKNQESAESETVLVKIHNEMGPSVQSRIHPGGKLIVIQTRWVENDVIGYIEQHWSDYVWATVNLPCECEDPENDPLGRQLGDSLMGPHLGDNNLPQRICNDNNWLRSKKTLVLAGEGEHVWNSLYQGHPSAEQGNLFHRDSWKTYDRDSIKIEQFEFLALSVDAAFKQTETSDCVSIQLWGIYHNDCYLLRLVNKRMGFTATVAKIKELVAKYPRCDQLVIEDKANGSAIIETLQYIPDMPTIIGIVPKGGKYTRAQAVSPFIASGRCHIPATWLPEEYDDIEQTTRSRVSPGEAFVEQHCSFPYAKHDDMVDAETQIIVRFIKMITGEEPTPQRRVFKYVKWYPDMWEDYEQMSPADQQAFIQTYGAPLEWADDYYS